MRGGEEVVQRCWLAQLLRQREGEGSGKRKVGDEEGNMKGCDDDDYTVGWGYESAVEGAVGLRPKGV